MPTGPSFGVTFFYYFTVASVAGTLLASQVLGGGLGVGGLDAGMGRVCLELGLILGIVAGGIGGAWNHHGELCQPLGNALIGRPSIQKRTQKRVQQLLGEVLTQLGYQLDSELSQTLQARQDNPSLQVYRPNSGAWLRGQLYVVIEPDQVRIRGRAIALRSLRQRLQQVLQAD